MMDNVERVARAIEPETFLLPRINLNQAVYERAYKRARDAIAAMPRNEDYMKGWRDALRLAVSVEVTPFYATNAMPNPKNLPTPPQQGGENAP